MHTRVTSVGRFLAGRVSHVKIHPTGSPVFRIEIIDPEDIVVDAEPELASTPAAAVGQSVTVNCVAGFY